MKLLKKLGIIVAVIILLVILNFALNSTIYNPAVAVGLYQWLTDHHLVVTYAVVEHFINPNGGYDLYPLISISTLQSNLFFSPRASVEGVVTQEVHNSEDGDWHINVKDNKGNVLVTEIIPELPVPAPTIGTKIKIWGVTRYDLEHRWWELHPVIGWKKIP